VTESGKTPDQGGAAAIRRYQRHGYRDELVTALRALSPRKREVVVLRHYCDMSEAAVADLLGVSVGTVKSLTSLGLHKFAQSVLAASRLP